MKYFYSTISDPIFDGHKMFLIDQFHIYHIDGTIGTVACCVQTLVVLFFLLIIQCKAMHGASEIKTQVQSARLRKRTILNFLIQHHLL